MNWDRIEGNWKQFKGQVKEQWGNLTDDDFDKAAGRRDQLAGRIQERYGITRDEANRQIDTWLARDDDLLDAHDPVTQVRFDWKAGVRPGFVQPPPLLAQDRSGSAVGGFCSSTRLNLDGRPHRTPCR